MRFVSVVLALLAFAPAAQARPVSKPKTITFAYFARVSASEAAQLLAGNRDWSYAADDDLTAEWYYYERQGWTIVTMDLGAVPPASHDMRWWAYYKTKNGTYLWTKFRITDPYASSDGWFHDWVAERTR